MKFSKLDSYDQTNLFDQEILKSIQDKCKLDFSCLNSVGKFKDFAVKLKEVFKLMKLNQFLKAFSALRIIYPIVMPLLAWSFEALVSKFNAGEITKQILVGKMNFCLQSLSCGLWAGLILYIGFQCYELYCVREAIKDAQKLLKDPETENQIKTIDQNIEELKKIIKEIEQLIEKWKLEQIERKQEKISFQIEQKFNLANSIYSKTSSMIIELKIKFNNQISNLKSNKTKTEVCMGVSGALTIVSSAFVFIVPPLAITSLVLNYAHLIYSDVQLREIKTTLRTLDAKVKKLESQKIELDNAMKKIKGLQNWLDEATNLDGLELDN